MRRRYVVLLATSVLFAVLSVLTAASTSPRLLWASSFFSNLAAGFLGSLITVALIDSAAEKKAEDERRRLREVAFAPLRPALLNQFILLLGMRRAAATTEPTKPDKLARCFDASFYADVVLLDPRGPAPGFPAGQTWFDFIKQRMEDYRSALQVTIDKYAVFLDVSQLQALEAAARPAFLQMLPLVGPEVLRDGELIKGHVTSFLSLCETFNTVCAADPITSETIALFFRPDLAPAVVGSARRSAAAPTNNPKIFVGPTPPPIPDGDKKGP